MLWRRGECLETHILQGLAGLLAGVSPTLVNSCDIIRFCVVGCLAELLLLIHLSERAAAGQIGRGQWCNLVRPLFGRAPDDRDWWSSHILQHFIIDLLSPGSSLVDCWFLPDRGCVQALRGARLAYSDAV